MSVKYCCDRYEHYCGCTDSLGNSLEDNGFEFCPYCGLKLEDNSK